MSFLRRLPIAIPAAILVICIVALWWTRDSVAHLPSRQGRRGAAAHNTLVDQRPWDTIASLAPLAVSAEEQSLAREAERLADHDIDQAFALALRQATLQSRTLTGDALAAQQKVAQLQALAKEDQGKVDDLTAKLKQPNGTIAQSDDLDITKAQLQLDNDELADANEQLARLSGDKRPQIQQELTARQAVMKKYDSQASGGQIAILTSTRRGTLAGRISSWFDQRTRMALVSQAKTDTDADVARLTKLHDDFEKQAAAATTAVNSTDAQSDATKNRVARMTQAHSLAQMHNIVEDQLETQTQLSAVYTKWLAQLQIQHGIVAHLALESFAWIAFILLCSALLSAGVRTLLERTAMDRRRRHTLRTIATLTIQIITLALILLILFGAPSQTPTILGLGAAGLTVVFQDFILAFFGWFILMGKNGIRVGDWVEINGVGGEVIEIGLFRTALLETGNWTDKGHPTGRRVTFINNFAITGQYFNFSTTGQWMWDEITVNIPPGIDSGKTIEAIHNTVTRETEKDASQAEHEWKSGAHTDGLTQFKATPSVDMRPAASGVDIVVRYVTRANDRFEMRNRLYQTVIDLLHKNETQKTT
ncbi:MAG TPA: mechanosensitive ion channel domain-containing protein [Edaphobacter sp.]|jgi:small-conductance mechanosensitive channel|nr:mechanosensitive ion channel domain-containing protein [Edaphobacter sp.]